jgi:hypothetical protein
MVLLVSVKTQDDTQLLQPLDRKWSFLHVGPLVNLVRHRSRGRQWNLECNQHGRNRKKCDISIGVEKASAQKIGRVHMVNSKRMKQTLAQNRHRFTAPGIGAPMNQTREEVREDHACWYRKQSMPREYVRFGNDLDNQKRKQEKRNHTRRCVENTRRPSNREVDRSFWLRSSWWIR